MQDISYVCKQMDNIFSPCVKQMSDTRSTIHAIPFHPSRPQQRSRVASGLWRRREILKEARYDRVAPMKTSFDCLWSLDRLPDPNPSQTFCDCGSLARLSALWQTVAVECWSPRQDRTGQDRTGQDRAGRSKMRMARAAAQQRSSAPVVTSRDDSGSSASFILSLSGAEQVDTGPRANLVRISSPGKTGVIIMVICKRRP
jgi:hypothetical protein